MPNTTALIASDVYQSACKTPPYADSPASGAAGSVSGRMAATMSRNSSKPDSADKCTVVGQCVSTSLWVTQTMETVRR